MTNLRYRNTYIDGCSHFYTASTAGFLPLLADEQVSVVAESLEEIQEMLRECFR